MSLHEPLFDLVLDCVDGGHPHFCDTECLVESIHLRIDLQLGLDERVQFWFYCQCYDHTSTDRSLALLHSSISYSMGLLFLLDSLAISAASLCTTLRHPHGYRTKIRHVGGDICHCFAFRVSTSSLLVSTIYDFVATFCCFLPVRSHLHSRCILLYL